MMRWTWMLGVVLGLVGTCQALPLGTTVKDGSQGETTQALEKRASELEQQCQRIAKKIADNKGLSQSDAEKKSDEDALYQAVHAAFEAKQKLHREEAIELEKKLVTMKQKLQDREKNLDDIVKRRVQELVQSSNRVDTSETGSSKTSGKLPKPVSPQSVKLDQELAEPVVLDISQRTVSNSTSKLNVSEKELIETIRDTAYASYCAIKTFDASISLTFNDHELKRTILYDKDKEQFCSQETWDLLKPGPAKNFYPLIQTRGSYCVEKSQTSTVYNDWSFQECRGRPAAFLESMPPLRMSSRIQSYLPGYSWLGILPGDARDFEVWKTRFLEAKYCGVTSRDDGLEYVTLEFSYTPNEIAKSNHRDEKRKVRVDFARKLGFFPISSHFYVLDTDSSGKELSERLSEKTEVTKLYCLDNNGKRIVFPCKIEQKMEIPNQTRVEGYEVNSLQINVPIDPVVFSSTRVREKLGVPDKAENEVAFIFKRGIDDTLDFDDVAVTFQIESVANESVRSQYRMKVTNCGERSFQGMDLRLKGSGNFRHLNPDTGELEMFQSFDSMESTAGKYDAESKSLLVDGIGNLKNGDSMTFDFTCVAADDKLTFFNLEVEMALPSTTEKIHREFILPRSVTKLP